MTSFDTQEWQGRVGKSWAAEWQRTDRSFTPLTAELLRRIEAIDFSAALDIGCGAGELAIAVARSKSASQVLGVDISPDLIEVARDRSSGVGNIRFELADAAGWKPAPDFAPDLLFSRHGVMFFSDPVSAFANLRHHAAPGARLLFSCFRSIQENPFFAAIGELLEGAAPPPEPAAPGPFAFADDARVRAILNEAGWEGVTFDRFDFRMIAGAGQDPVSDAVSYFTRIGPAARAIAAMDDSIRASFKERLREFSQHHLHKGEVGLAAGVWIVSARSN